jgi:hypothetical protein
MPEDYITIKELHVANSELIPEVIKLLNEGHTVTLSLKGRSMRPFLQDGRDKALLTKAKTIKRGDAVLAIINNSYYVLHRIFNINGDNVTLLGDGNITPEHCRVEDVKGFVIGFYRNGREKMDKTNGFKWTSYSFIWMLFRPMRRYLLAALRLLNY